jgi:hypothetical protein
VATGFFFGCFRALAAVDRVQATMNRVVNREVL